MSRLIKAVAMALVLALTFSLCGFAGECGRIRERVLRLHILANSDSEEDQQLKLQVRDAVVAASAGMFDGAEDESEALERAREQLPLLEKTARQIIADAGYDYDVEISLCNMYFTTRFYDGVNGGESVTLPAGMYDAVRIVIGEGAGRNWWCVVFPPLCVSAAQESGDSATLDIRGPVPSHQRLVRPARIHPGLICHKQRPLKGDTSESSCFPLVFRPVRMHKASD